MYQKIYAIRFEDGKLIKVERREDLEKRRE
jgi:hypothetical protein